MSKIEQKLQELGISIDDEVIHPKFKKAYDKFVENQSNEEITPEQLQEEDDNLIAMFEKYHKIDVVDDEKVATEKAKTEKLKAKIHNDKLKQQEEEARIKAEKEAEEAAKAEADKNKNKWTKEKQIEYLKNRTSDNIYYDELKQIGIEPTGEHIDLGEVFLRKRPLMFKYEIQIVN